MINGNGSKKRTSVAAPEISLNADKNKEKIYKIDETVIDEDVEGDDDEVEGDGDTSTASSSSDNNLVN